jgi:hypothetical protein
MSGRKWLTVGLSVLVSTAVAGTLPGMGVQSARAESVIARGLATGHGAQVQAARWGDASGEQGEVESPRWGDASGEQGEVESPRSGYQGGDQTDAGSPRT